MHRKPLNNRVGGVKGPAMIWNEKKIVGIENIKQALKETKEQGEA